MSNVPVPVPSQRELEARVRSDRLPKNIGRRVASVVTGVATVGFGGLTATMIALLIKYGLAKGGTGIFVALSFIAILASMTFGFGFLTWRWARGLPPAKSLALTERERDEIDEP